MKQGPKASEHDDMFEFFETVIEWYKQLPSYRWLSSACIRPSNTTTYTLSDIQDALTGGFGALPFVGCTGPKYNETEAGKGSDDNGATQLSEIWYYYHVNGGAQRVDGVKVDAPSSYLTSCAKSEGAIWYYERAKGSEV